MTSQPFRFLQSRAVVLLRDDVDTDQIIPARFLTTTAKAGLGRHLFADWRIGPDGTPTEGFALNASGAMGSRVLVAGRNFGCGSSREHASWALMDWGFHAVIAESFGDIFRNNAHKNGLLTIALGAVAHLRFVDAVVSQPGAELTIDLRERSLRVAGSPAVPFDVDPFVRHCLIEGLDELDYLLAAGSEIAAWECGSPGFVATDGRDDIHAASLRPTRP
jgi:3-isopropylmalate/(R)-2-methylmalate dehydratase small subunit